MKTLIVIALLSFPFFMYSQNSSTCVVDVDGETFEWEYGDNETSQSVLTHEITQPGTNNGFIFDIFKMDNSFNMEINGLMVHF